jgi:cytochrome P450
MQLLLDALSADDQETTKYDHLHLSDSHSVSLGKRLTYAEIKANLKMFMLAGYESTSYALNYCFYVLAINQNEQQTLLNEIDSFYSKDVEPTNENVKNLTYLDLFCKEILRFYPISRV